MSNRAQHLASTRFKPGEVANPAGRPKGSRSKLQELCLAMLHKDFAKHGETVIERVRERRPESYLAAVVSLLPKQQEKVDSPFVDLTDQELDQLEELLAGIRAKTVKQLDATAIKHEPPKPLEPQAQTEPSNPEPNLQKPDAA